MHTGNRHLEILRRKTKTNTATNMSENPRVVGEIA